MKTYIQIIFTLIGLTLASSSFAGTLYVEKWGADSGTCGSKTDPCLTIGQAIANASAKDKIIVGPGEYTEASNLNIINKDGLKLESVAGRYATIIVAGNANASVISITSDKVQLGKMGKGFTITGATGDDYPGVYLSTIASSCKVEGNRMTGNDIGMVIEGEKHQIRYNQMVDNTDEGISCSSCDQVVIQNNEITDNDGIGIESLGTDNSIFTENLVSNNGASGFETDSSSENNSIKGNVSEGNSSSGFLITNAVGTKLTANISAQNVSYGFFIIQINPGVSPQIKDNLSAVNSSGFNFVNANLAAVKFEGNTAVQNNSTGVISTAGVVFNSFKNNNTYSSGISCGIANDSGTALTYIKHFFGDAAGPNPPGVGDGPCGADASTGSFVTKPNSIKTSKASAL